MRKTIGTLVAALAVQVLAGADCHAPVWNLAKDAGERRTISLLSQKTPTAGWWGALLHWGRVGSPITLAANDADCNCGWFSAKPGREHAFVTAARKGMTVACWNGRALERFSLTVIPNLEPILVERVKPAWAQDANTRQKAKGEQRTCCQC